MSGLGFESKVHKEHYDQQRQQVLMLSLLMIMLSRDRDSRC